MPYVEEPVDFMSCVAEFYILQIMDTLKMVEAFKPSHNRWLNDFNRHKQGYESNMARAIYDYLTLACFGEARHAMEHASMYLEHVPQAGDRTDAGNIAKQYTPASVLKAVQPLFRNARWGRHYGGDMWGNIADGAMLYQMVPDTVFIDHCIDLSHNSGPCFDKADYYIFCLYDNERYKAMLTAKSNSEPYHMLNMLTYRFGIQISRELFALCERAVTLGIVPDHRYTLIRNEGAVISISAMIQNYEPVAWGSAILNDTIIVIDDGADGTGEEDNEDDEVVEGCYATEEEGRAA